ncbi:MAG: HAMP domain-containing histidine kinase [Flavobacterium sp.]|nr:HAMP domain-containing histidine kinase [Pedobacter sp.]
MNDINAESIIDLQNEKKYFASILSHDLRSPLSSIVLLASYIKTKSDNPEMLQYIELIEQSSRKELHLMATLLSLMRTGTTLKSELLEEVDLRSEADKIFSALIIETNSEQFKCTLILTSEIRFLTNLFIFKTLFNSLLTHAIKLSAPKQKVIITANKKDSSIIIQIKFLNDKITEEDLMLLFSSDMLLKDGIKEFPDRIDLYFCQKLISTLDGTIHAKVNKSDNSCSFMMILKQQNPPRTI